MSSQVFWPQNELQNEPKELEILKEEFSKRLGDILTLELTVENVTEFGNIALDKMSKLLSDIKKEMLKKEKSLLHLTPQAKEDYFLEKLNLKNVPEILDLIHSKEQQIKELGDSLEKSIKTTTNIITPPDQQEMNIGVKVNDNNEKKIFLRLLTLIYILNNDFQLNVNNPEEIFILRGIVTNKMVRKTPYNRVVIFPLNKVVYICDEEGNATFLFDKQKLQEHNIRIRQLDDFTKEEKNFLLKKYPGIGVNITQQKNWRYLISEYLKKIPNESNALNQSDLVIQEVQSVKRMEFSKSLTLEELQESIEEIKEAYQKEVDRRQNMKEYLNFNIHVWYRTEKKKHHHWPGKEILKSRTGKTLGELLRSEEVIKEILLKIQQIYKGEIEKRRDRGESLNFDIYVWYRMEKKKHHHWPYTRKLTEKFGKGLGELFGHEKIVQETFQKTVQEIKQLYQQELNKRRDTGEDLNFNIQDWYRAEKKKHLHWPYTRKLTEKFGKTLSQLLHSDEITKEIFQETFQEVLREIIPEIRQAYQAEVDRRRDTGEGLNFNIQDWYRAEKKKHEHWLSDVILSKQTGKTLVRLLRFEETIEQTLSEIRQAYQAEVDRRQSAGENINFNINAWYNMEKKKHEHWLSSKTLRKRAGKSLGKLLYSSR